MSTHEHHTTKNVETEHTEKIPLKETSERSAKRTGILLATFGLMLVVALSLAKYYSPLGKKEKQKDQTEWYDKTGGINGPQAILDTISKVWNEINKAGQEAATKLVNYIPGSRFTSTIDGKDVSVATNRTNDDRQNLYISVYDPKDNSNLTGNFTFGPMRDSTNGFGKDEGDNVTILIHSSEGSKINVSANSYCDSTFHGTKTCDSMNYFVESLLELAKKAAKKCPIIIDERCKEEKLSQIPKIY